MPLPSGLRHFNRAVTNRLARPVAARTSGFAVLGHKGRRSGTSYKTPLNAWRHGNSYVVALTYGPSVDWLRNVRATGTATLTVKGHQIRVGSPYELSPEDARKVIPAPVRVMLGALNVGEFVAFPVLTDSS
jgi:deazaflavin-dependent oxidoreductase (nitroreductase family)